MWWQVQKVDGSSGVVPASYLVLDGGASFEILHPGRGMFDESQASSLPRTELLH